MSEFSVHRTAGGGYCLILDDTRIAGAKPEFSNNNCVTWWVTDKTYGPIDGLKAKVDRLRVVNGKLWRMVAKLNKCLYSTCLACPRIDGCEIARYVLEEE